jgi:hypothetical protein
MTGDNWSEAARRYLDGDGPPPADPAERERADRLKAAFVTYAGQLVPPGPELDRAVLAALRARRLARRGWWRWLVEPQQLAVRPAIAAATIVVLLAAGAALAALIGPPERGTPGGPLIATATGDRTILVRFEVFAPDARSVALAGSFNGWSDSTTVFSRGAEPGVWSVTVALPPGEYQYLFVVDGRRWIPDPAAHAQVADDFGQRNSLLVVGPRGVVRS